jgi:hypothetical protein
MLHPPAGDHGSELRAHPLVADFPDIGAYDPLRITQYDQLYYSTTAGDRQITGGRLAAPVRRPDYPPYSRIRLLVLSN